jgi:HopA1 effector protein family
MSEPGATEGAYREAVEQAVAATTVLSSTAFAWFGAPQQALAERSAAAMDATAARAYLVYALQTRLYTSFYCLGAASPDGFDAAAPTPRLGPSPFVWSLSRANRGTGSREPGWTVAAHEDGRVVVERDGLRLWVRPEELHRDGGAVGGEHAPSPGSVQPGQRGLDDDRSERAQQPDAVQPGAQVGVRMPKELRRLSPGFYMALGDAAFPSDASAAAGVVRCYWSLRSEGAAALVERLTGALNEAGVAFRLKVIADPEGYRRCDAGVLYTLAPQYELVAPIVADTHRRVEPWLRPASPALTKPLAPGLALAEDPGAGTESFGMNRCRLLAEGIVDAAERGAGSVAERTEVVAAHFAQAQVSLERPYLRPGSVDSYSLPEVPAGV